jgi:agmatine deiminase
MPAEWERHYATWLTWPNNKLTFIGDTLPDVELAYVQIIKYLVEGEMVQLLMKDSEEEARVRKLLEDAGVGLERVSMHIIPAGDVWFRDYGPIFVAKGNENNRQVAFTHWDFNVWGNKYEDIRPAAKVVSKMPIEEFREFRGGMVLEGGSIDTNGKGTFLTTEQCLLNKNRNPELQKAQIEKKLRDNLGALHVVWLGGEIAGDDTNGHIDDLARFVSEDSVVCAVEEDRYDENFAALHANYELLLDATNATGKRLDVVPLNMPKKVEYDGQRLPASYTNFYIGNSAVLVPAFDDPNDKKALSILKRFFPKRKVVGIDCRSLVVGFGAIHCITQQQPAGKP